MFTNPHRYKLLAVYYSALLVFLGTTAMHIPDGYLSPATSAVMFALVFPFWAIGVRKVRQSMSGRSVPLIALLAAFSFVIMMFNVPLPGGTTGHAVGASLAAILLGPEIATIAVSIALIIQALFFGDGGILAIGANCFNMAVVIPYTAAAVYDWLSRGTSLSSPRRFIGAALGGWLGVTLGALFAGVEFGLQPLLFKGVDGAPLYAPYPLAIAVPAMVIPHALSASVVEGLLTALILAYVRRSNIQLLLDADNRSLSAEAGSFQRLRWLWVGLIVLMLASPVGLLAPGTAWGEWGTQQLEARGLATIPAGLQRLSGLWGAPLAGYRVRALGNASLGYILSAVLGILLVAVVVWLFARLTARSPDSSDRNKQAG
jgi:cobalt/nickel transport system permease protein